MDSQINSNNNDNTVTIPENQSDYIKNKLSELLDSRIDLLLNNSKIQLDKIDELKYIHYDNYLNCNLINYLI